MDTYRSALTGAEPFAIAQAPIVVSEFPLNPHESFRAEILNRQGRSIAAISRWKTCPAGRTKRTGVVFEFGAHRIAGVAKLVSDLQRVLNARLNGDAQ